MRLVLAIHLIVTTTKPQGYQQAHSVPVLRGRNHCHHCFFSPCLIALPPDFLRGSCSPHPANEEKQHRLYRMF